MDELDQRIPLRRVGNRCGLIGKRARKRLQRVQPCRVSLPTRDCSPLPWLACWGLPGAHKVRKAARAARNPNPPWPRPGCADPEGARQFQTDPREPADDGRDQRNTRIGGPGQGIVLRPAPICHALDQLRDVPQSRSWRRRQFAFCRRFPRRTRRAQFAHGAQRCIQLRAVLGWPGEGSDGTCRRAASQSGRDGVAAQPRDRTDPCAAGLQAALRGGISRGRKPCHDGARAAGHRRL